jgi:hypothetical protein
LIQFGAAKGRKQFFFEKKNQKTFVTLAGACGSGIATRAVPGSKVFVLLAFACGAVVVTRIVPE